MSLPMVGLTSFAHKRHFAGPTFVGTRVVGMSAYELVTVANRAIAHGVQLVDGGHAHCKILALPNHSDTKAGIARVTDANIHRLRSGYVARHEGELPVLTRWFEGIEGERAAWLHLILYSRAHLEQESAKRTAQRDVPSAQWGIVSINAELDRGGSPPTPETMLHDNIGVVYGGSGAPLDSAAYAASVAFWERHAVVRQ